jgi:hypothetical protein
MKNNGPTEDKDFYVVPFQRGVILTKDNVVKHNWQGSEKCCFCQKNNIIKHLFFECSFAGVICISSHHSDLQIHLPPLVVYS